MSVRFSFLCLIAPPKKWPGSGTVGAVVSRKLEASFLGRRVNSDDASDPVSLASVIRTRRQEGKPAAIHAPLSVKVTENGQLVAGLDLDGRFLICAFVRVDDGHVFIKGGKVGGGGEVAEADDGVVVVGVEQIDGEVGASVMILKLADLNYSYGAHVNFVVPFCGYEADDNG